MGGGTTMRAAVAAIRVVNSGLRGGAAAEYPASKAVPPASAGVVSSSSDGLKAVQLPVREIADRFDAGKPREVFGPVPSLQEAKEATAELKDALEKLYFSPPQSSSSVGSFSALQDTKACITNESSVSNGAVQAYMFLKERPDVQAVIASIACDPNVWSAVVQNAAFMEFVESEKRGANSEMPESPKTSPGSFDDAKESGKPDGFWGFMKDVKHSVQQMVSRLANYAPKDVKHSVQEMVSRLANYAQKDVKHSVQEMVSRLANYAENLFQERKAEKTSEGSEKNSESSDGTSGNFFAIGNGGTLMALVLMVIMILLTKRV